MGLLPEHDDAGIADSFFESTQVTEIVVLEVDRGEVAGVRVKPSDAAGANIAIERNPVSGRLRPGPCRARTGSRKGYGAHQKGTSAEHLVLLQGLICGSERPPGASD